MALLLASALFLLRALFRSISRLDQASAVLRLRPRSAILFGPLQRNLTGSLLLDGLALNPLGMDGTSPCKISDGDFGIISNGCAYDGARGIGVLGASLFLDCLLAQALPRSPSDWVEYRYDECRRRGVLEAADVLRDAYCR